MRFLTPQGKSFLAKNMIQSDCNVVPNALKPIKTTIETLKIKTNIGGDPLDGFLDGFEIHSDGTESELTSRRLE